MIFRLKMKDVKELGTKIQLIKGLSWYKVMFMLFHILHMYWLSRVCFLNTNLEYLNIYSIVS